MGEDKKVYKEAPPEGNFENADLGGFHGEDPTHSVLTSDGEKQLVTGEDANAKVPARDNGKGFDRVVDETGHVLTKNADKEENPGVKIEQPPLNKREVKEDRDQGILNLKHKHYVNGKEYGPGITKIEMNLDDADEKRQAGDLFEHLVVADAAAGAAAGESKPAGV